MITQNDSHIKTRQGTVKSSKQAGTLVKQIDNTILNQMSSIMLAREV